MPRTTTFRLIGAVLCAWAVAMPAAAQSDSGGMPMQMEGGWRMVPMTAEMPMLPGLEGAVPPVGAYLPGAGLDIGTLPPAEPPEVLSVADGDTLDVSVSMVRKVLAGHEMALLGYNRQTPGPLIKAPQNGRFVVRVSNEIQMPTTIHWHGVRLDNAFDGVPGLTQEAIGPGERFTYEVRVPDAGLFWYHPHVREDVQLDLGLFGNLLVTSPDSTYYGPAHREVVYALDDMLIDDRGPLPWGDRSPTHALMGRFGNVLMVNGDPDHRLEVERGEVVRFYMTNVANSRTFNVTFGGGEREGRRLGREPIRARATGRVGRHRSGGAVHRRRSLRRAGAGRDGQHHPGDQSLPGRVLSFRRHPVPGHRE